MADALDDYLSRPVIRWTISVLWGALVAVTSLWIQWGLLGHPPNGYECLIFISPICSIIVATHFFMEYPNKAKANREPHAEGISKLCTIAWACAAACCFLISLFSSGAMLHVVFLLCLFGVYAAWDWVMLRYTLNEEMRIAIIYGNRLINRPTLVALALVLLCILAISAILKVDVCLTRLLQAVEEFLQRPGSLVGAFHAPQGYREPGEMFVIGAVSLHLFMSTVSYMAIALTSGGGRTKRALYWALNRVPDGPAIQEAAPQGGTPNESAG